MKKMTALLLTAIMLLSLMPVMLITALAETEIITDSDFYTIGSNGEYQLAEDFSGVIFIASDVTAVTVSDAVYKAPHANTSIVVNGGRTEALELTIEDLNITASNGRPGIDFGNAGEYDNILFISGTSNIVGGNSYSGINVPSGAQLTIDKAESVYDDEDALLTSSGGSWSGAGIGGNFNESGGTIIINGGTIEATGGIYAAGIGGGSDGASGDITISGGIVTATAGVQGAGIGGGVGGPGEYITISGGEVAALSLHGGAGIGGGNSDNDGVGYDGGNITINGGTVNAICNEWGAAIGGGNEGSGGNIIINGGIVTATSGKHGAGIGGGSNLQHGYLEGDVDNDGGIITINGGTVKASAGDSAAGIGGGIGGNGGKIIINGGTVEASGGGGGSGIGGGGWGDGGTIKINGGTVEALGGANGAGIGGGTFGSGGTISIRESTVTATGGWSAAGIGGGWGKPGGDVTIIGAPIVVATGYITEWSDAEHIGKGDYASDSGTLKDDSGNDLSYLRFNTSEVSDVKISLEGIEGSDGEYLTNDQGIYWMFVPYTEADEYSYMARKAGYAAVEGSGALSSTSHDISIEMNTDNTPPVIQAAERNLQEAAPITAVSNDYGIYGSVYLVNKTEAVYTSKAALEEAYISKAAAASTISINTEELDEGLYQLYLVDSAENVSVPVDITMDYTKPVIGLNTVITRSEVTQRSVILTWEKATDNYTAQADLEYSAYISRSPNLDTVENIEANGRVLSHGISNPTRYKATGLNQDTTYYFNVVVTDKAGNKSCYSSGSVTTKEQRSRNSAGTAATISTPSPVLDVDTGTTRTEISTGALSNAYSASVPNASGISTVTVAIPKVTGAKAYEISLPVNTVAAESGKAVEIKTDMGTVTLPSNMMAPDTAGNATNISLTVGMSDTAKLSPELQEQIGSRPIIELSLKLNGEAIAWNNPDAPAAISIPYTPTEEERANPENITVWYIDGAGKAVSVPSGRYNPATGMVSFTTTHFSKYAVVYVKKSYSDLGSHAWAKKQIEALSAKGIMDGRTATEFKPSAGITRAEFIGSLVRTLGVSAKTEGSFSDVKTDDSNYNEIAVAKKLGITNGTGGNSFKPQETINRQDMLVLTERALRSLNRINETGTLRDLEQFADRAELDDYAVGSIAALVKEGLIVGSNGMLNVGADTTRAEAAVFLYRIYNRQ